MPSINKEKRGDAWNSNMHDLIDLSPQFKDRRLLGQPKENQDKMSRSFVHIYMAVLVHDGTSA